MNDAVADGKLPLGLCKQICLKFDSALSDIQEVLTDPDLTDNDKETFFIMLDMTSQMSTAVLNIVNKECGIEDFLNENIPMDNIGMWPSDVVVDEGMGDILDQTV